MNDWFSKTAVDARTTMLTEPFVHDFMRANIWHLRGRDALWFGCHRTGDVHPAATHGLIDVDQLRVAVGERVQETVDRLMGDLVT